MDLVSFLFIFSFLKDFIYLFVCLRERMSRISSGGEGQRERERETQGRLPADHTTLRSPPEEEPRGLTDCATRCPKNSFRFLILEQPEGLLNIFLKIYLISLEKESVCMCAHTEGEGQKERIFKPTPHWVQNPTLGSIPRSMRSGPEQKPKVGGLT